MENEKISFKIGHPRGNEAITFHLRMISVAEDSKFLQKFIDLADDDAKTDKEYQIYVDALADWAVEMPMRSNGDGKDKPLGKSDPQVAIKEYFAQRTPKKEWVADYAIRAFRSQLQPDVSFL
jgi:hypothetical protein